jgi:hypothetical protein
MPCTACGTHWPRKRMTAYGILEALVCELCIRRLIWPRRFP